MFVMLHACKSYYTVQHLQLWSMRTQVTWSTSNSISVVHFDICVVHLRLHSTIHKCIYTMMHSHIQFNESIPFFTISQYGISFSVLSLHHERESLLRSFYFASFPFSFVLAWFLIESFVILLLLPWFVIIFIFSFLFFAFFGELNFLQFSLHPLFFASSSSLFLHHATSRCSDYCSTT